MRAGGCTVQQTLTSEAASVLKHSLGLARRRGHAQVTPLHVAATLLSSRISLLRRACLKSHPHSSSHPLQCRALELCFNVALNRLPTTPGPLLHGQPSLSNALIAALKRAQAHQRRGCIEQQQQQPLLAIKVELEQLIISILDDPSVSRVMREAGFSSTSVKNNLEDTSASSVFQCYTTSNGILPSSCSPSPTESLMNHSSFWQTHFMNCSSEQNPLLFSSPSPKKLTSLLEEDLRLVVEVLLRKKRRNTVIVGDSFSTTESLVEKLMGKVERGDVPDELRSAHFIKFQFPPVTLKFMKREDVEMKIADLRRKVSSLVSGGGAIIYAGDLKWAVEANERDVVGETQGGYYSPVEHLVAEIGRLLSDHSNSNSKVWLMATANYQTYMRCQMKQPSLETQWALQAVSLPSGGLGLSLHASSGHESRMTLLQSPTQMVETKPFAASKEEQDKLTCCAECTSNFDKDAGFLKSGGQQKTSSLLIKDVDNKASTNLPYWLQTNKIDSHCKDDLSELRKKWNRLCHSLHHPRTSQIQHSSPLSNKSSYNFASSYSWWPAASQHNQQNSFPQSNSISFAESTSRPDRSRDFVLQFGNQQPSRSIEFGLGDQTPKDLIKGLSLDSLKSKENKDEKITLALGTSRLPDKIDPRTLSKQLQDNVPWQSEVIPSITEALLNSKSNKKNGIWLLIQGDDWIGKRRLAQAIAESVYGSTDHIVHVNMRSDDQAFSETLLTALRKKESCVVLIEEMENSSDSKLMQVLTDCYNCNFNESIGGEASFPQTTFIVTKGGGSERTKLCSNRVIEMKLHVEESNKRKAEWSCMSETSKAQRTSDREETSSSKVFSRQSSSNTLDLNILAEEVEEEEDNKKTLRRFPESIEHQFDFGRSEQMTDNFKTKLKASFEEVFGKEKSCLCVDELVLEEIVINGGRGILVASLFEKWLKDIFQTSLQTVKNGGKEGTVIRLSLGLGGGKEEEEEDSKGLETGYMGSNLPKTIQVTVKE